MSKLPATGSAADDVNDSFHTLYDDARAQAEQVAPVFVVLADSLIVFRDRRRSELPFTPRVFHVLKSIAHAPIALFALLHRDMVADGAQSLARRARAVDNKGLTHLRKHVAASLEQPQDDVAEAAVAADARAVLASTLSFIDTALAGEAIEAPALAAFAAGVGAALLRLSDAATREQLAALHARAEEAIAPLDAEERRTLQVVVAGAHQARARSLAMQYFQKRLREPEGVEVRVAYAEGVDDEEGALALVGTRRLDHAIANAFFGDARRLQRDILGDAAAAHLAKLELAPLL